MRAIALPFFISLLAATFVSEASAQNDSIDWFAIAGGGGQSTGSVYSVNGTIGQLAANSIPMSGGNYALAGGFWAFSAVQTPGAPHLTIALTSTNTLVVSWPISPTAWTLQQNNNLASANWETSPAVVNTNATENFIIVHPTAGNQFYRLFRSP